MERVIIRYENSEVSPTIVMGHYGCTVIQILQKAISMLSHSSTYRDIKTWKVYGRYLWYWEKESPTQFHNTVQNKVLRNIVNASWKNKVIVRDLNIPTVKEEKRKMTVRYEDRLHQITNAEAIQLPDEQDCGEENYSNLYGAL